MKYNRVIVSESNRLYIADGFQKIGSVYDILDKYNTALKDLESTHLKDNYNFCIGFFDNGIFVLFLYGRKTSMLIYDATGDDSKNNSFDVNIQNDDDRELIVELEREFNDKSKLPNYKEEWKMIIIKNEPYSILRQNSN